MTGESGDLTVRVSSKFEAHMTVRVTGLAWHVHDCDAQE